MVGKSKKQSSCTHLVTTDTIYKTGSFYNKDLLPKVPFLGKSLHLIIVCVLNFSAIVVSKESTSIKSELNSSGD